MQTFLPIQDLCTFKKWNLLIRIIVVIIQNIVHSRLPTLLDQDSFVEWITRKHLLLYYQVLANKDFVNLKSSNQAVNLDYQCLFLMASVSCSCSCPHESIIIISSYHNGSERCLNSLDVKGIMIYALI